MIRPTLFTLLAVLQLTTATFAQEIEPRRWSHIPTGTNFVGIGYAYSDGNVFVDPSLQVEDARAEVQGIGLGYIRSFGLFGKSTRVDFNVPYATGRWSGLIDGVPTATERDGFGDASMRLSINLAGAPALAPAEFATFSSKMIVGAGVRITAPTGQYQRDRLINLSSNRWTVQPQVGVVYQSGRWATELTASAYFYTDNDAFRGTSTREVDPFYTLQAHAVYTVRPGLWFSGSVAYGKGARATVDGVRGAGELENILWATSFGYAFNRFHGMKIAYINANTVDDFGLEFDRVQVSYSYMWGEGYGR